MSRVAMVSGASRGIGKAIALDLAGRGYRLSLGIRTPGAAGDTFAGTETIAFPYEASSRESAQAWVDATKAAFGRIDVLVNAAGVSAHVGLDPAEGDEDALERLLEINVKGPWRLIQAALPSLRQSGSGRVVNLSSLSGKRVLGANVGYQMSKHAVIALTHAVRRAGWDDGVRATSVCPGFVATDMTTKHHDTVRPEEMTQPEDLARLVGTTIDLPNTAGVSELLVNWRYEHTV